MRTTDKTSKLAIISVVSLCVALCLCVLYLALHYTSEQANEVQEPQLTKISTAGSVCFDPKTGDIGVYWPHFGPDDDGDGRPDPIVNTDALLRSAGVDLDDLKQPEVTIEDDQLVVRYDGGQIMLPLPQPAPRTTDEAQDNPALTVDH